eukprot:359999-Chlamydomonas_euryale.AAC.3
MGPGQKGRGGARGARGRGEGKPGGKPCCVRVRARAHAIPSGRHAHSGGRSSALAMSTLFTTFVLMPLPLPSI